MIRLTLPLLLLFFTSSLIAQDTLNRTDAQGRRPGIWTKTDTAGHKVYEGRFLNGKPTGEFRYFYPSGKVKAVSKVSHNGRYADAVSYYPNGKKMAEGRYIDEKKDSLWTFYGELDGAMASQDMYRQGKLNGESRIFYPEGSPSEVFEYRDGVKDGKWEQYYPDGKLKLKGNFKGGDKAGPFQTWYASGTPMMSGQYRDGHQDGTWTFFDDKGKISRKETYREGWKIAVDSVGVKH